MADTVTRKSLLQHSMEGGVWLGLYLIVRFAFMVMGLYYSVANLIALALFAGTPFVLYRIMMVYHRNNSYISFFSLLWMMGIMLFFFTSLISSLAQYIYYVYINPDYIRVQFQSAVELMESLDLMAKDPSLLDAMKAGLEKGNVPSPMSVVVERMWVNLFFGSLLSAAIAWLVKLRAKSNLTKQ